MTKRCISSESIIHQIDDIVASDIDDEKVMMSVEKGEYFGLDPIGSRVWDMIDKPIKVTELIDLLLPNYDWVGAVPGVWCNIRARPSANKRGSARPLN